MISKWQCHIINARLGRTEHAAMVTIDALKAGDATVKQIFDALVLHDLRNMKIDVIVAEFAQTRLESRFG